MTDRRYHDSDGNEVSLPEMCRREPDWAANRIQAERSEHMRYRQVAVDVLTLCSEFENFSKSGQTRGEFAEETLNEIAATIKLSVYDHKTANPENRTAALEADLKEARKRGLMRSGGNS